MDDSAFLFVYVGQLVSHGGLAKHFIGDLLEGLHFSQLPAVRYFPFLRRSDSLISGLSFLLSLGGYSFGSGFQ